jgi:hypothetical protein
VNIPLTPWQEYKKKIGETRPWDLINPNMDHAAVEEIAKRMSICEECPSYLKITGQCKQCGCFMKLKTKLQDARCPDRKW